MQSKFLDVNPHGVLSVPLIVWAIMLFEARTWLLVFLVVVSAFTGISDVSALMKGRLQIIAMAELPIVALIWAAVRRTPEAGAAPRWLWRHGRELISFAALCHVAWSIWRYAGMMAWRDWNEDTGILLAVTDLLIAVGIWLSPYCREMFAEFPEQPEPDRKG